jgi:hypothetical protein
METWAISSCRRSWRATDLNVSAWIRNLCPKYLQISFLLLIRVYLPPVLELQCRIQISILISEAELVAYWMVSPLSMLLKLLVVVAYYLLQLA